MSLWTIAPLQVRPCKRRLIRIYDCGRLRQNKFAAGFGGGYGMKIALRSDENDSAAHAQSWNIGTTRVSLLRFVVSLAIVWSLSNAVCANAQIKPKFNPADGLSYVWIPPATFTMGCSPGDAECNGNETSHRVRLSKGFWMGQTLVTQMAYEKITRKNPSAFKGNQLPVETVSWNEAKDYCQAVKMRLPTEAEWEYAARG